MPPFIPRFAARGRGHKGCRGLQRSGQGLAGETHAVAEAVADPRLLIPSSLSYPQRNMKLMRSKGSGEMEQLLERCKQVDEREGK